MLLHLAHRLAVVVKLSERVGNSLSTLCLSS